MAVEIRPIVDREQWLGWRRDYITASQIGACPAFACHPYHTALRVYAEKRGVDFDRGDDSKVLRRGRWLEASFPKIMKELRPEWEVIAPNVFLCDPEIGIGCTPDFYILNDPRGLGVLQAKTVAYSVWRRDWDEGKDIPLWVTLQALTEAMMANAAFAVVAPLLVDPHNMEAVVLDVPRHTPAEYKIVAEVKRFWQDIKNGVEPDPDFVRDGTVLKLLIPREIPDKPIDLSSDNSIRHLLARRAEMMAEMKRYEGRCEIIENKLRHLIGDAAVVTGVDGFGISYRVEPRKGYVVKPSEPRVLRIRDKRPVEERPVVRAVGGEEEDDE